MGRQEDENKVRGNWANKWEYLLSIVGYTIDLGNVWRFPYLCYRHGGGAFLFPYLLMLFILGIPLFLLESAIGQFSSSGCLTLYNVCPIFKGIGYTTILITLMLNTYYSVLVAYPLVFLVNSFSSPFPWASCDNWWNTADCTEVKPVMSNGTTMDYGMTDSSTSWEVSSAAEFWEKKILQMSDGVSQLDGLVWPVVFATFFVWVVVFLCIFKGVKVVGKVAWLTTTFPLIILFALFIRGVTLPGAYDGIYYYIYPDFEKLLRLNVWRDAAVQIIFTLAPGFGSLVTMSSLNRFRNNCLMDAFIVPILNSATSIFAGFAVFSVIGFMANQMGRPVYEYASSGPGLAFIFYPEAMSLMPLPTLWSVLVFLMLFFLGISSIFIQVEAIVVSLVDEFQNLRKYKSIVAFVSCLIMFLIALFCCSRGGMYVLTLLDSYPSTIVVIFCCLSEIIVFSYIYGSGRVVQDLEMMTNKSVNYFWYFMWLVLTPLVLLIIFIHTAANTSLGQYRSYVYPYWTHRLGWVMVWLPMSIIPLYALYYILAIDGPFSMVTFSKRLVSAFTPNRAWGPALESHRAEWVEYLKAHPLRHHLVHPKLSPKGRGTIHATHDVVIPLTNTPEAT